MNSLGEFSLKRDFRPFLVGNWKMHGCWRDISSFLDLLPKKSSFQRVLAFPAPYWGEARKLIVHQEKDIQLAAQNLSSHEMGAYSGQINAKMAKESGCSAALLGHPECFRGVEDNESVARAAQWAHQEGVFPWICLRHCQQDRNRIPLAWQKEEGSEKTFWGIALEPWVGGDGIPDDLSFHLETLRNAFPKIPILYGGGVSCKTVGSWVKDFDGFLLGRASLSVDSWQETEKALQPFFF